jgi:hypothetical protein
MHRHAPPEYDCPFCAFVRGEERPPWSLREDVVWRHEARMTEPEERQPYAERLRATL